MKKLWTRGAVAVLMVALTGCATADDPPAASPTAAPAATATPTSPDAAPTTDVTAGPSEPAAALPGSMLGPYGFDAFPGLVTLAQSAGTVLLPLWWRGETVAGGTAYPDRLHGLAGGITAWQRGQTIVVCCDGGASRVLVEGPDGAFISLRLTGSGVRDGAAVVLASRERASTLEEDGGGEVVAYTLDGTATVLQTFEAAYEGGSIGVSAVDDWLLVVEVASVEETWVVHDPDGGRTVVGDGGFSTVVDGVLRPSATGGDPTLVLLLREDDGRYAIDERSVGDLSGVPLRTTWLDGFGRGGPLPKQLQVDGDLAVVTLLPDAPLLAAVDLATGDVRAYNAAELVALHPRTQVATTDVERAFVGAAFGPDGWGPVRIGDTPDEVAAAVDAELLETQCAGVWEVAGIDGLLLTFVDDALVRLTHLGSDGPALMPAVPGGVVVRSPLATAVARLEAAGLTPQIETDDAGAQVTLRASDDPDGVRWSLSESVTLEGEPLVEVGSPSVGQRLDDDVEQAGWMCLP